MNYATWKLNFDDPFYGTGPEQKISDLGSAAEAGWVAGQVETGGTILGYLTQAVNESELTDWEVKNITQAEALLFCQAINENAYLKSDGRIAAPSEA